MLETNTIITIGGIATLAVLATIIVILVTKKKNYKPMTSQQSESTRILNYPNLFVPNERPYWNTTLGGGYYGTRGWPFWAYHTGFPYGECTEPCACSTPFKCEDSDDGTCPQFSGCTYS